MFVVLQLMSGPVYKECIFPKKEELYRYTLLFANWGFFSLCQVAKLTIIS